MTREEAANKMMRLRHMFVGLELVRADNPALENPEKPVKPKRKSARSRKTDKPSSPDV